MYSAILLCFELHFPNDYPCWVNDYDWCVWTSWSLCIVYWWTIYSHIWYIIINVELFFLDLSLIYCCYKLFFSNNVKIILQSAVCLSIILTVFWWEGSFTLMKTNLSLSFKFVLCLIQVHKWFSSIFSLRIFFLSLKIGFSYNIF